MDATSQLLSDLESFHTSDARPQTPAAATMGEAVDVAILAHEALYPQSEVHEVTAGPDGGTWYVEVRASHFGTTLVYRVPRAA